METLDTMKEFTDNHIQKIDGNLEYVFAGGASIRLHQEKYGKEGIRKMGDFDLVVLGKNKYPVQTFDSRFELVSGDINPREYVDSIKLKDKEYFFTDGDFTAVSKTCSVNIPCEKGYHDIKELQNLGVLNFDNIENIYNKVTKLKASGSLARNELEKILNEEDSKVGSKMFETFPNYVNLASHFEDVSEIRSIIKDYIVKNPEKAGYSTAIVLGGAEIILDEFKDNNNSDKIKVLNGLLNFSKDKSHVEFDREIHRNIKYGLSRVSSNKRIEELFSKF